ncbi:MAG: hypothetical protein Q8S13_04795, partial [Dehalococcoidia bacterium]|nr:hypothetical protein [Dehalococcoidia bacterium]
EGALDALRRRLAQDDDPRDEELLDQLRQLTAAFAENTAWRERVNAISAAEIAEGVEDLFQTCVRKLDEAFTLLTTANGLPVTEAQRVLHETRERMLNEVVESVNAIAEHLTSVYTLGTEEHGEGETVQVRQRIQQSLDIARKVEDRLSGKDRDAQRARLRAAIEENRQQGGR